MSVIRGVTYVDVAGGSVDRWRDVASRKNRVEL